MLISSEASAEVINNIVEEAKNPAGFLCLDSTDVKAVADFKKKCDLDTMDMKTYKGQFESCFNKTYCEETVTSSKAVFWSSIVSAFIVGFAVHK